jgi:predicted PurR-regulated permease PerM
MTERIRRAGQVSWAIAGMAAVLAVVLLVGWFVRVIWPPLVLAGAITFLLNPVVTFLQGRGVPRAAGTGLAYLGVVAIVVLAALLVAPMARQQWDDLSDRWPELREDVENGIDDLSERSRDDDWPIEIPTAEELEDALAGGDSGNGNLSDDERQERLFAQLDTARELGLRVFHVGLIFVIGPIIAFYLLVDLPHIRRVTESLIPEGRRAEARTVGRRLNQAIGGYFRGQLGVAAIVGTMASIALAILGLPFWLVVGLTAGLFNMVPLIGPWVGAVPGVVVALTTRDVGTALWVVGIMAGVQQIDNHFISPVVMQRTVKLHPVIVMLALLAGGTLGGFLGLLLAVPVAATLKILIGHLWRTYVLEQPLEVEAAVWAADDAAPGGVVEDVLDREPVSLAAAGAGMAGVDAGGADRPPEQGHRGDGGGAEGDEVSDLVGGVVHPQLGQVVDEVGDGVDEVDSRSDRDE